MTRSLADPSAPRSSLLKAGIMISGVPAASAIGLAAGLAAGVSPAALTAAGLFSLAASALIAPVVLQRTVGARVTRLADLLRAARDGRLEATPPALNDPDAIGDIARLVGDILAVQADVGRYAMMIRRANALDAAGATLIGRMEAGAIAVDEAVGHIEARISLAAAGADRAADLLTNAAERASSTGATFGRDSGRLASLADTLGAIARQMQTALESRRGPDTATAEMIGGIASGIAALKSQIDNLRAATARDLAGVSGAVNAVPAAVTDASARAEQMLARRLDDLASKIADIGNASAPAPTPAAAPAANIDLQPIMAELSALDGRITARLGDHFDTLGAAMARDLREKVSETIGDGLARIDSSPAEVVDLAPVTAGLAVLERRLDALRAAPPVPSQVTDALKQLSGAVEALSARLADDIGAMQARLTSTGSGADIDLGRSSLQNLIVAFRLAIREIGDATGAYREAVADLAAAPPAVVASSLPDSESVAGERQEDRTSPMLVDLAARLGRIEEALAEAASRQSRPAVSGEGLGEIDIARSSLQNLIVAFRMAIREIADATGSYREAVAGVSLPAPSSAEIGDIRPPGPDFTELSMKIDRIAAVLAESREAVPASPGSESLGELDLGRSSLQRLLVALRLAIRDVAGETERFGSAVDAAIATGQTIAERFGSVVSRLDEAATDLKDRPLVAAAPAPEPATLPIISFEREPVAPALTALRSLMREMASDAETLHTTVERLAGISLNAGGTPEPVAPLIADIRERIEAGHAVLADLHGQVAQLASGESSPAKTGTSDPASLRQTVSLMGAFTAATEARFTEIENRIAEVALRAGSGDGGGALEALVTALYAAAGELRAEISEFLAVGAALTQEVRDLGAVRSEAPTTPQRRRSRP